MLTVIVEQANDGALNPWHSPTWIFAARIKEILHFASVTAREPIRSVFQFRELIRSRYAAQVETQALGLLHNPNCVCRLAHPEDCAAAERRRRASDWKLGRVRGTALLRL